MCTFVRIRFRNDLELKWVERPISPVLGQVCDSYNSGEYYSNEEGKRRDREKTLFLSMCYIICILALSVAYFATPHLQNRVFVLILERAVTILDADFLDSIQTLTQYFRWNSEQTINFLITLVRVGKECSHRHTLGHTNLLTYIYHNNINFIHTNIHFYIYYRIINVVFVHAYLWLPRSLAATHSMIFIRS